MLYAAASLPTNAVSQAWALWLVYFYAPPADSGREILVPGIAGIDPRLLLGAALTAARLIEALDDPLIGYWSDRTRSRWGRRLPFVVLGTPLWAVLFVLLFAPPSEEPAFANAGYLFVVAVAFYGMSNLSGAPLEALLPQLARRNDDRVSVASWQVVFGVAGAVVGLSLSALLQQFFGFVVMAATVAAVALVVRYVAVAGVWRHALADNRPSTPGLRRALRETFRNPAFLAFLPSFVLFQVGLQMLTAVLPFYVDTILGDATLLQWSTAEEGGIFTFLLTGLVIAGMLAAVPLFSRRARHVGKATAYRTAMLGVALYFPLLFFIGLVPGVPALPHALIAVFLAGVPMAGVFLFPNIITADIVDYDEGQTNTRREAMFYGAQNLLEKLATALAPLLFALVLLAGDSREDPTGIRLVGPVAGLLVLGGYIAFRSYWLEDPAARAG